MVKRIIYPPIWLVLGLIAIFALNEFYPGPRFTSWLAQVAGSVFIVIGLLLLVFAGSLFKKAGTDFVPFRNVSALVTIGLYRYTRNPMYLGMVSVLLGCVITVGSSLALCVPVLFVVIIEARFIRPEESILRELFPKEYPAYCNRVRRWI
jgi:protein-S-isoprenylcysteine O-methyltransferase Ste14